MKCKCESMSLGMTVAPFRLMVRPCTRLRSREPSHSGSCPLESCSLAARAALASRVPVAAIAAALCMNLRRDTPCCFKFLRAIGAPPLENYLVLRNCAGDGIDVFDAKELLPRRDQLGVAFLRVGKRRRREQRRA